MLFSTFHIMHLLEGADAHRVIHDAVEAAVRSELMGYTNVWLAEHHTNYCITGSPSVVASTIAAKTDRVGIGTAVNILPLAHPYRLAEELSLLDHLSNGRVIAGFGSGNQQREFDMLGVDFEGRSMAARAPLDIIRRLWSGEAVTAEGASYTLKEAKLAVRPLQDPHPPISIAVASVEAAMAIGELGYGIQIKLARKNSRPLSNLCRNNRRRSLMPPIAPPAAEAFANGAARQHQC